MMAAAASIALTLTVLGILTACVRLILGPSLADRVVALDLVTVLMIAVAGLLALTMGQTVYLDISLALALIGFLATVAFARYTERRPARPTRPADRSEFDEQGTSVNTSAIRQMERET